MGRIMVASMSGVSDFLYTVVRRARLGGALALCLPLLGACEERELQGPPPADHGEAPTTDEDPLGARVHALGLTRAPTFAPEEGQTYRGALAAGERQDHAVVLVGTRCYVVAAVATESMENLNITLIDPRGAPIMRDDDEGAEALIGLRHAVCPNVPGAYRVRVEAEAGQGDYVMRVYGQDII